MTQTTSRVPVNALDRAVAAQRAELQATVAKVIDSGWYVLGPETESFEHEFADALGLKHCVGVGNGTDALEIALLAIGVRAGDTVATVANAGMYATSAIVKIGAQPLFVDVSSVDLLMDVSTLSAALARRGSALSAVVVTHLFGQFVEMAALVALCDSIGVPVVEDCAQAVGATRNGRMAGSLGAIATYSFYPTKNLGALGDGGAVATDDGAFAERARRLRQYGWEPKYHAVTPGGRNTRLDEIQAAVLRLRLPRVAAENERRRSVVARYIEALQPGRRLVVSALDASYSAHLAVLRTPSRDADRVHLEAAGVATDIHYPVPDHLQPALDPGAPQSLPVTEAAAGEVLTVPCFPYLREDEIERVCAALGTLP
ncbi:MAG: erythromycin biosynthesis sensory transduction protein eryC1 [Pseudonocardiales bacterium]|nr:MAG: erythromycin biosynthesis sensory transduction protein eryC1 [Pseudonocardiales bacterium]